MSEEKTRPQVEWPKYLVKTTLDGHVELEFMPIQRAGVTFDSGWAKVEILSYVLLNDKGSVRLITNEERREISRIADEYSASK